ncbi:response regulator [Antarcticibacterium flavum]|uniref:Response regulator n=1 Tax=Antarcticibacterium flavum TaxID=2058175 RepID=A0A5B7X8B5_9FLAO|nr:MULTISPECIES: response regulator [Antarcticibacterium]MCM4159266.1 response regulator [Antarcticibacterium sp. W02-3]QCY71022.1 response regulator [Antarcticibacterium flavum]
MKKALIIQEDIVLLNILERLMTLNSYDCRAVRTIADLDIEDQSLNYDLIISEILFEGIAPLDFVFQIQEIITHKEFIILSNMGQPKVRREIMESNKVKGFFSVPFDLDHIQKLIL